MRHIHTYTAPIQMGRIHVRRGGGVYHLPRRGHRGVLNSLIYVYRPTANSHVRISAIYECAMYIRTRTICDWAVYTFDVEFEYITFRYVVTKVP